MVVLVLLFIRQGFDHQPNSTDGGGTQGVSNLVLFEFCALHIYYYATCFVEETTTLLPFFCVSGSFCSFCALRSGMAHSKRAVPQIDCTRLVSLAAAALLLPLERSLDVPLPLFEAAVLTTSAEMRPEPCAWTKLCKARISWRTRALRLRDRGDEAGLDSADDAPGLVVADAVALLTFARQRGDKDERFGDALEGKSHRFGEVVVLGFVDGERRSL